MTEELIAIVLGTGTRGRTATDIARDVLTRTGGLVAMSRAGPRELAGVPGIGEARGARLAAAFHLGRRALSEPFPDDVVRSPADVYAYLRPRTRGLAQEAFFVLALDARNSIVGDVEIARGSLTGVEVHPREVFRPLIRQAAAAAVVAHNHPSGDPSPSDCDLALTRRLRRAGDLLGIPLLDHVILGADGFTSLAEMEVPDEDWSEMP